MLSATGMVSLSSCCCPRAVEDLAIEAFIPELAVEGLAVAVLLE